MVFNEKHILWLIILPTNSNHTARYIQDLLGKFVLVYGGMVTISADKKREVLKWATLYYGVG